jgi:radical SAM protein with 4Fe4S-binding SPASM domain
MTPLETYLSNRIAPERPFAALSDFPLYFEIETVNACNARCPMCTIDDWTRHTPTMKDDLFERIAKEICAHKRDVKRVALYRDGEPLLDKKLPRRIKRLKGGGIKNVGISTNVELLDEERATAILEAGIDEVVLSIDSLDKSVFEAIRVRLNFETVMANALRFVALRDKIRPTCSIWVRMIRQESNRDEFPAFYAYWKPLLRDNDRCYFLNIHNWGGQLAGFDPEKPNKLPCVALWSLMVIFADGKVPMCNVDYNNKHPLGDVATHSIAELWQSKLQNDRRTLHLEGKRDQIDMCASCTVWNKPASDLHRGFEVAAE